jgi:hypothetical protein
MERQQQEQAEAARKANWIPTDDDYKAISALNASNIKDVGDGATLTVIAGGAMALIGSGHSAQAVGYVRRQGDLEEGTLSVTKGGAFSKGGIEVAGISAKQGLVQQLIEEFSAKKVTFA